MKAAFIQTDIAFLDPQKNREEIEHILRDADYQEFPDLVVLPELITSGYFFSDTNQCRSVAENIPGGDSTAWLIALSQEFDAHFVAGLAEKDGHHLYNSAVLTGPEGYIGTYRKAHLYYQEKLHFEAGSGRFPVYELTTRDGTEYVLGLMICFDWYYPEAARSIALRGADVIAHPSNLVRPDCPRAMPIRALENHLFTITANRTGSESQGDEVLTFIGQSRICDPSGQVLGSADRQETALKYVEITPADARDKQITTHNDLLRDRRTELYE